MLRSADAAEVAAAIVVIVAATVTRYESARMASISKNANGRGRAPAPPNLALGDRTRVKTLAATQRGTRICPDWNLGKCKAGKCPKGLHACNGMVKGYTDRACLAKNHTSQTCTHAQKA